MSSHWTFPQRVDVFLAKDLAREEENLLIKLASRTCALGLLFLASTACATLAASTVASTAAATTPVSQLPGGTIATPFPASPTSPTKMATVQLTSTVLTGHSAPVTNAACSADGQLCATTAGDWDSADPTIRLWRADGTLVKVLRGHTAPVISLAWSPDGRLLASGSLDTTIQLWLADGTLAAILRGREQVFAVAWSPDSQLLASASAPTLNPTVWLWQRDGTPRISLSTRYTGGKFYNLAWSPDGKFLLGGAVDYGLWRADGTEVFHLDKCAQCTPSWGAAWSPDSKRWAIGDESGNVYMYDLEGHLIAHMQNPQGNVDALAWSPDGQVLAGGDGVNLWQRDGRPLVMHASFGRVNGLAWSPSGQLLASSSTDAGLHLWSADGRLLDSFPGSVIMVAWSPDGQLIAAASANNNVQLWRIRLSTGVH